MQDILSLLEPSASSKPLARGLQIKTLANCARQEASRRQTQDSAQLHYLSFQCYLGSRNSPLAHASIQKQQGKQLLYLICMQILQHPQNLDSGSQSEG